MRDESTTPRPLYPKITDPLTEEDPEPADVQGYSLEDAMQMVPAEDPS